MKYHSDQCPECGDDLQFDAPDAFDGSIVQRWVCPACDTEGHDWYEPSNRMITVQQGVDLVDSLELPPSEQ